MSYGSVRALGRRWRGVAWRHPEWWSLALSAAAWGVLVAEASDGAGAAHGGHPAVTPPPVGGHGHLAPATMDAVGAGAWSAAWFHWLVMIVAMMVPLVMAPLRTTAARSLWARRHRGVGGFLLGYLAPWSLLGIASSGLWALLAPRAAETTTAAAALGFAGAAAWQLTALRERAERRCHRTMPLAPTGWRADRDCLRYGWATGCRCVASCWALMVACLLAGHGPVAMLAAMAIGAAVRYAPRADRWLAPVAMTVIALAYVGWGAR